MSLWDWAVEAYARPGAAEACLELQDRFGQQTCLLLWAVWAGGADEDGLAAAAALARRWEAEVLAPLRTARRALKAPDPSIPDAAREGVRGALQAAELAAEKALLEALEPLAAKGECSPLDALRAASAAWGRPAPDVALAKLAKRLAPGALYGRARRPHHGGETDAMTYDRVDESEEALRGRLAALRQEHADLDAAVQAMTGVPLPDLLAIGRLKRRKLQLKDEISRLEDQLTPDIIA